MIYRTPQYAVDQYYQSTALNQTTLKLIAREGGISYLDKASYLAGVEDEMYAEEKEHFIVGSAVDCFITMGQDHYDSKYHFANIVKPGDKVMAVVKRTYDIAKADLSTVDPELKRYREIIWEACNAAEYFMNRKKNDYKDDSRVETILKDVNAVSYFRELIQADGKQVLSNEQHIIINNVIGSLTTHKFTSFLFQDAPDRDLVYQFPCYFDIDGIYCKALPDLIAIRHDTKRIYIVDIKTLGAYITEFYKAMKYRRYDLQADFYSYALPKCLTQLSELIGKDLSDYTFAPFAFAAESTKRPGTPLIFITTKELLRVGRYGGIVNGDRLNGWHDGIEIFKLWEKVGYQPDYFFEEHQGRIQIGENFEYENLKQF